MEERSDLVASELEHSSPSDIWLDANFPSDISHVRPRFFLSNTVGGHEVLVPATLGIKNDLGEQDTSPNKLEDKNDKKTIEEKRFTQFDHNNPNSNKTNEIRENIFKNERNKYLYSKHNTGNIYDRRDNKYVKKLSNPYHHLIKYRQHLMTFQRNEYKSKYSLSNGLKKRKHLRGLKTSRFPRINWWANKIAKTHRVNGRRAPPKWKKNILFSNPKLMRKSKVSRYDPHQIHRQNQQIKYIRIQNEMPFFNPIKAQQSIIVTSNTSNQVKMGWFVPMAGLLGAGVVVAAMAGRRRRESRMEDQIQLDLAKIKLESFLEEITNKIQNLNT